MPDELRLLRLLRPEAEAPEPDAVARSRAALAEEIAAARPPRARYARWLVPCFVVALFGAGGLAAAGLSDWWIGGEPPVRADEVVPHLQGMGPSSAQVSTGMADIGVHADLARTVVRAPGAAIVAAPADEGRLCYMFVPDAGKFWTTCLGASLAEEPFLEQSEVKLDGSTSWYVYGRVAAPGAERVILFEELTYPLDQSSGNGQAVPAMTAEVGDHGFFILRVDETSWPAFNLAYASMRSLDAQGETIDRTCWHIGTSPTYPLTGAGGAGPHVRTTEAAWLETCPAQGSLVAEALMTPAPHPRSADVSGFAGTDLLTGERLDLADLQGQPVVMLVTQHLGLPLTMHSVLRELDVFAQRHPNVHVLAAVNRGEAGGARDRRAVRALELGFPVILGPSLRDSAAAMELLRDSEGGFGVFVVALDATGRIAGELLESGNPFYDLIEQEQLDELLATAGG
jgi:hypothetical protein